MKHFLGLIIIVLILSSISSCKDNYDFSMENLSDKVEQKTDLALPLVNASIKLSEILPDDEEKNRVLIIDENDFITLEFDYELKNVLASDFFNGDYSGTDLSYIEYSVEPQIVELGLNSLVKNGELYISNPKLTFMLKNYWDVATQIKLVDFFYYPEDDSEGFPLTGSIANTWIPVNQPVAPADYAITNIVLDTVNSNIDTVLSALPKKISIAANFETIPGGPYNVNPNSTDSLNLKIEIPLDLLVTNLTILDTMDFHMGENLGEDTSYVESLQMNLVMQNGFPMSIAAQIYFADTDYNVLDSVSNEKIQIESGVVTSGKVTSSTESIRNILISQDRMANLLNAKYLIVKVDLNTANAELGETVKIYSSYAFGLKIGALIKLKLKM